MGYMNSLDPMPLGETKDETFAVADIESAGWVNFLVVGHTTRIKGDLIFKTFTDMRQYFWWLFSEEQPVDVIYSHFGGKFDFLFFMRTVFYMEEFLIEDIIPRSSSLLCIKVTEVGKSKNGKDHNGKKLSKKQIIKREGGTTHYRKRSIHFRDSSAMLPFSLRSLCKNFHVKHPKLDIDYEKITKVTPELIEYLEHDCKGLYEVIEKYYEWPLIKKAGTTFTMAGQAMRVFRTFLKKPIYSLSEGVDEFVRAAYFGGRTEIFKPLFMGSQKNLLSVWDVNSLYPTVMRENDFPTNFRYSTYKYNPKEMGFFDAEVDVPLDMYVPPLGTVLKVDGTNKFIFPVGRFSGRWSTVELEYARSLGVKIIKTGEGMVFSNGGPIFKEYVDELYKIREASESDSVDNVLAKLLLNSCYGRFGLRRDRESVILDHGQEGVTPLLEIATDEPNTFIRLVTEPKRLDKSFSNVAISAWVTSLARIHMHKIYLKCEKNLYYTDTDSLFTRQKFAISKGLGALKHEYDCDSACFLLPKTYIAHHSEKVFKSGLYDKKGDPVMTNKKIVMKGFDKKKIQHFEPLDFLEALEGDLRMLKVTNSPKFATFKSAIRKNKFVTMLDEQDRQIRSVYDKRTIYKTKDGYDTKPLVIKNGEIVRPDVPGAIIKIAKRSKGRKSLQI